MEEIGAYIIVIATIVLFILSNLFFPKIRLGKMELSSYWVIACAGALLLLAMQIVPIKELWESFTSSSAVNPLKILVLFLSMTFLSVFLDEFGFFAFLAERPAARFSKSQYALFFALYFLISFLTVFTSNDIIILTFTRFICYFCKHSRINPIPYLLMEFIAANTWSMVFIIGNPTNIYLASFEEIGFFAYFKAMILPTIGASLVTLIILFLWFRKDLKAPLVKAEPSERKLERLPIIVGLIFLIVATVLLAVSSFIGLQMWIIAFSFALLAMVFLIIYGLKTKENHIAIVAKKMPWPLVPFVLSMFVLVLALNRTSFIGSFSTFLQSFDETFSYGVAGTLTANLINNIPMSVLFASFLEGASSKAIYASIIASNVAAYFTPIGALAGLMWLSLLKKYEVKMTIPKFVMYGSTLSLSALICALLILRFVVII